MPDRAIVGRAKVDRFHGPAQCAFVRPKLEIARYHLLNWIDDTRFSGRAGR
jgi:hypothetical protein